MVTTFFWICWSIDALLALIAVYFFLTGIATATNGVRYFQAWLFAFLLIGVIIGGSLLLKYNGYPVWAMVLAGLPALIALLSIPIYYAMATGKW
jgi:hypothetical protein